MIVSQARIDANRSNAARSTGPRTISGKNISRLNSIKHGLCSTVVVVEDAELVRGRSEDLARTFRPEGDFQRWLVDEAATLTVRIGRCQRMELEAIDRASHRAELAWDDDRRIEAAALGASIGKRPGVIVERLRATPQGCDWLIARWAILAHAAESRGSWTPGQVGMAFDLMGTPADFREGDRPGALFHIEGRAIATGEGLAAIARREIAGLEARRERVVELDEADRSRAEAGLVDDSDPQVRRIRRYESGLQRRLQWCLGQLHRRDSDPEPSVEPEAARFEPPAPDGDAESPRPFETPRPRFDPPPQEPPTTAQEAAPASRLDKKLKKAESRREARRRKVDRLRG